MGAGKSTRSGTWSPALSQAAKTGATRYDGGAYADAAELNAPPPFKTLRIGDVFRGVIEVA
jgi:hypothetical protein